MFSKNYQVLESHIDFQNVMDGLYYPFYMEWCRHDFMKSVLGIDIVEEAKKNNNYVLTEYNLKFKKSIKSNTTMLVTCQLKTGEKKSRFYFEQSIIIDGAVYAEARFEATCIPASGRPCVPVEILQHIQNNTLVNNEN